MKKWMLRVTVALCGAAISSFLALAFLAEFLSLSLLEDLLLAALIGGTVFGFTVGRWWTGILLFSILAPVLALGYLGENFVCILFWPNLPHDPLCTFGEQPYLVDNFDQALFWGIAAAITTAFISGLMRETLNRSFAKQKQ